MVQLGLRRAARSDFRRRASRVRSAYDISARKPASGLVTYERAKPMLRALLEDRFGLKTHRESRRFPDMRWWWRKGGSKLKAAGDGTSNHSLPIPAVLSERPGGPRRARVYLLSNLPKQPVANRTSIAGNYDLKLRFAREGDTNSQLPSCLHGCSGATRPTSRIAKTFRGNAGDRCVRAKPGRELSLFLR